MELGLRTKCRACGMKDAQSSLRTDVDNNGLFFAAVAGSSRERATQLTIALTEIVIGRGPYA